MDRVGSEIGAFLAASVSTTAVTDTQPSRQVGKWVVQVTKVAGSHDGVLTYQATYALTYSGVLETKAFMHHWDTRAREACDAL